MILGRKMEAKPQFVPFSQKGPAQIISHICEILHLATKVTKVEMASISTDYRQCHYF